MTRPNDESTVAHRRGELGELGAIETGSRKRRSAPVVENAPALPTQAMPQTECHVYEELTARCVPDWTRIVGTSPWWDVAVDTGRLVNRPVMTLVRQQASAFGLSAALRLEPGMASADRLTACVRTALIHWQASLDPEGCPVSRRGRTSRLWPVVAQQVVRLADGSGTLACIDLLDDLTRHLRWLLRRSRIDSPWILSALIESLACGAPLVRDADLLSRARERLPELLDQQSTEGWFRERGGADIGRLSLTIDALTRLYLDHHWEDLAEPLERALGFLGAVLQADGSAGGCYGSCNTGFISPYAPERLADRMPEGQRIAETLRERFAANRSRVPSSWHDNVTAVLGAGIAATAHCPPAHRALGRTTCADTDGTASRSGRKEPS